MIIEDELEDSESEGVTIRRDFQKGSLVLAEINDTSMLYQLSLRF